MLTIPLLKPFADVIKRAGRHNIFLLSAGIAFNALLCVIPLMLVGLTIAGAFVTQGQVEDAIIAFAHDFFPRAGIREQAKEFIINEVRNFYTYGFTATGIGLLILLWSASVLVSSLRASLNFIFGIIPKRFYLINKIRDMGLTLIFLVLLLVASFVPSAISIFTSFGREILSQEVHAWLTGFTAEVIGIASLFLFFLFVYRILPNKRLSRIITLGGSTVAVILWELARFIFGWYLNIASSFGKVYGAFAVLGTIAIWIYYTGYIILFTAEVMGFIDEKKKTEINPL